MSHEELIAEARAVFRESSGWELGISPGSELDIIRRLADALEATLTHPVAGEPERDELARVVWETSRSDEGTISATGANIIAGAILAAGYRKPREVTTVEELDALPVGAVVRQDPEDVLRFERADGSWEQGAVAELRPDISGRKAWFLVGSALGYRSHQADLLPATVIFTPEGDTK